MSKIERMQALIRLALEWLDASVQVGTYFMPDEEGDKISKIRTHACAIQLLRELSKEPGSGKLREMTK